MKKDVKILKKMCDKFIDNKINKDDFNMFITIFRNMHNNYKYKEFKDLWENIPKQGELLAMTVSDLKKYSKEIFNAAKQPHIHI